MKVVRVLGVSIAIGCSILLVNAGGAVGETSVDAQGVTPSGFQVRTDGSWTYYDRKLPSDFDVVIEKGAFDREGQCFFSSSREVRGDEGLIEGVEIAYSAKTCERRVAERKITSETASLIEDEHRREVGEPQIDTGGSVSSPEPARSGMVATASRRIQTISWFEDPRASM